MKSALIARPTAPAEPHDSGANNPDWFIEAQYGIRKVTAPFAVRRCPGLVHEGGAEPHPNITRAINALEAAKGDLQDAAHDYCGHRVAALEATNAALNQLGSAINCQERRGASAAADLVTNDTEPAAATAGGGERHPLIRAAVNALRSARRDLQAAAHEYCGHRAEALEATNAALNQLQLALACDSR